MENFLPALFIIGAAIYKIYTEYQKEQEKARKRRPTVPAVPSTPPVQQATQPAKHVKKPEAPKHETIKEMRATQVAQAKAEQKTIRNPQKKEIKSHPVEKKVENHAHPVFNLREAIIQEAVLRRPYQ